MAKFRLPRSLHVTADWSKAVEIDDPSGAFVLGGRGSEIDYELAVKLNLVGGDEKAPVIEEEKPYSFGSFKEESKEKAKPKLDNESANATAGAIELANQEKVNLHTLQGSGKNGRISKADVQSYLDDNVANSSRG